LDALFSRRLVVCVGPGGVGKTTVAASLALAAARRGLRTGVVTIDPARRLAETLGLTPGSGTPADDSDGFVEVTAPGIEPALLRAALLEPKRAFDRLVDQLAPDTATRDAIHQNAIYQHVSDQLAGSAEYAAMARVHELASREDLDLLVVDTPPSAHALDFLDAPARLAGLLDSAFLQWLIHPAASAGRFGWRIFQRGTQTALHALERITGLAFLEDISEFLLAFESMAQGFRDRAGQVEALLFSDDAAFVLTTGAGAASVQQTEAFRARLEDRGIVPAAVVANRVRRWPGGRALAASTDEEAERMREILSEALRPTAGEDAERIASAACSLLDGYAAGVNSDLAAIEPLLRRTRASGGATRVIPEFAADVHDFSGLAAVEAALFDEELDRP
jgi:anion-transporting  ArsA/GET3 family ATPase